MRIAIATVLAVLPIAPLLVTWRCVRKDRSIESATRLLRIAALITTVSFALLLAGLMWGPVLGPDYSQRRLAMIYANLAIVGAIFIATLFGVQRSKVPLGCASCMVALEWLYLAVVSSLV
jgi:cytochrome c oxidase assembly factor CtaG